MWVIIEIKPYLAPNVLEELEVAEYINAGHQKSVPVDALQLDVGIVLLEVEVQGFVEVDIWPLNHEMVLLHHTELGHLEVLWEYLHL